MRKLYLPSDFYSDFREPTDMELKWIRESYDFECGLRMHTRRHTVFVCVMIAILTSLFLFVYNCVLKILALVAILELLAILFVDTWNLRMRQLSLSLIDEANFTVKYVDAVEPVRIGRSHSHMCIRRMRLQIPGVDKTISVPTTIRETDALCDIGLQKSRVLLVLLGSINRMIVIPCKSDL